MGKMNQLRTYSELILLPTFGERYDYLKLNGSIGSATFGFDRWINQRFYKSAEWQEIRNKIIIRDNACDLGMIDREIPRGIIIHHMNPIALDDIVNLTNILLDPEFLICTSLNTHNAIHYGNQDSLVLGWTERTKGDTLPWKTAS